MLTFIEILHQLERFWERQGCAVLLPYDLPVGAGTFHPATFLYSLGSRPNNVVYPQSCRRPTDGRYGENPNRLGQYYQLQVIMKPVPANFQELYLESLKVIGLKASEHDFRFIEDNWESPTLGAWGLGWEVWVDGMEVSQFTYFQQVGGQKCEVIPGEITYGLERLAMYLQNCDDVYDLAYSADVTYGDLFRMNEKEMSIYNFEKTDIEELWEAFSRAVSQAQEYATDGLVRPGMERVMEASHTFNLLDARRAVAPTARQELVLRIRTAAQKVAEAYLAQAEKAS